MSVSESRETPVEIVQQSKPVAFPGKNPFELFIFKEVKAFGATQFVAGLVQMTFGIPLFYSSNYSVAGMLGTIWWTGVWCSVSGVMNMYLYNSSNLGFVRATLLVNGFSTFVTGAGIALYVTSILFTPNDESIYFIETSLAITVMLIVFAMVSLLISFIIFAVYCKHAIRI